MKKYTVKSVMSVEMNEFDYRFYIAMNDGTKFEVNMHHLSEEDIEGLKNIEGYDEKPEVFERLMEVAEER